MRYPFRYEASVVLALASGCRDVFGDAWFLPRDVVTASLKRPGLSSVMNAIFATVDPSSTTKNVGRRVAAFLRHINELDIPFSCHVRQASSNHQTYALEYQVLDRQKAPQPVDAAPPIAVPCATDPVVQAIERAAAAIIASQEACALRIIESFK